MRDKIEYILKHNLWVLSLYKVVMSAAFRFLGLFVKTDENLILYNSYMGNSKFDSPLAIFNYISSHPQYAKYRQVWAFSDPDNVDLDNCEKVKIDTLKYFITALRAKYWVTNVNIERGLHFKKKNTIYLNTWHGVSLNVVGNDVPGRNDYDFSDINFLCYESEFHKKVLMRAFKARESSMLPSGLPRNDELYNVTDQEIVELKKKLGLPLDKKIIMYAPTWRDSADGGKTYQFLPPVNFKYWEERLGNNYVLILRTHHLTTKFMDIKYNDFVRDFVFYPRINDLFKVSDILISDYSSCLTDFCILERPIISFAYDYDEYAKARGFNINFRKDFPNGIFSNEKDIINHIINMDYKLECSKTKKFKDTYTYIGGCATKICVESLINI